jgi:hypothetical protein
VSVEPSLEMLPVEAQRRALGAAQPDRREIAGPYEPVNRLAGNAEPSANLTGPEKHTI